MAHNLRSEHLESVRVEKWHGMGNLDELIDEAALALALEELEEQGVEFCECCGGAPCYCQDIIDKAAE